jgi:hypothetical protein
VSSFAKTIGWRHASKARARRRRQAGGAVMFIVAMTLAVIAAMGVYALQMASTEVKTAGFIRQQLQTQYLSEYGVVAAAQALTVNPQVYATVVATQPDTGCFTLYQISTQPTANPQSKACHRAGSTELGTQVVAVGAPATLLSAFTSAGSDLTRGTVGIATFPDFFVEVTDPNPRQPPPGYASNSSRPICFEQVTASAMGLTPTTATSNGTDTYLGASANAGFLSEGFEMARARIVFGPVRCTGTN